MGLDKMDWRKGKEDKEKRLSRVVVSELEAKWYDMARR